MEEYKELDLRETPGRNWMWHDSVINEWILSAWTVWFGLEAKKIRMHPSLINGQNYEMDTDVYEGHQEKYNCIFLQFVILCLFVISFFA